MYTLVDADGQPYCSDTKGTLGGNSQLRIYGTLQCGTARNALGKGYEGVRVFFADENTAIAAGYRPCGNCMRARYRDWRSENPTA